MLIILPTFGRRNSKHLTKEIVITVGVEHCGEKEFSAFCSSPMVVRINLFAEANMRYPFQIVLVDGKFFGDFPPEAIRVGDQIIPLWLFSKVEILAELVVGLPVSFLIEGKEVPAPEGFTTITVTRTPTDLEDDEEPPKDWKDIDQPNPGLTRPGFGFRERFRSTDA